MLVNKASELLSEKDIFYIECERRAQLILLSPHETKCLGSQCFLGYPSTFLYWNCHFQTSIYQRIANSEDDWQKRQVDLKESSTSCLQIITKLKIEDFSRTICHRSSTVQIVIKRTLDLKMAFLKVNVSQTKGFRIKSKNRSFWKIKIWPIVKKFENPFLAFFTIFPLFPVFQGLNNVLLQFFD